ncbi:caspase family protein [Roseomonas harenae]|uniref:caspase family protein n=1 Tax=Muricoccus harenae TaxID=2692566 RepID=UPI001331453F|nr:caspase family protein [Roseomonas harenae]
MTYPADLSYGPVTRVVLFGTSRCPRDEVGLPALPQVEQNILYLARLFADPDIVGLPRDSIVVLLDRAEASDALNGIAEAARQASDTLIVYYAGHGLYGDANSPLYLAVGHTTRDNKSFNGVSITQVKQAMRASRARKRVLILDCCYSGRAFEGGMSEAEAEGALRPAIDVEGTYGIAAAPGDMKALAPPDETLTRFTGALVDVLERGVERDDPVLTLDQIFHEMEIRIGRKADAPLPKQINWDRADRFCMARNRSLHRRGLDRIFKAVEGLRETVTAAGARLQAVEAKASTVEELAARLAALEGSMAEAPAGLTSGEDTRASSATMWEWVKVPRATWEEMPAYPYKNKVRRYFAGRRNAKVALAVSALLTGLGSLTALLPVNSHIDVYTLRTLSLLTLIGSLTLGSTVLLGLLQPHYAPDYSEPSASSPVSVHVRRELEHNEVLGEVLNHRTATVLGFALDGPLGWFVVFLCVVGAIMAGIVLYDIRGNLMPPTP